MRTFPNHSTLPTPTQALLLRAALLNGAQAHAAWQAWQTQVDIDQLDEGSFRLLPLLYHNLHALGIEGPLTTRLKGVFRYWWSRNQALLFAMAGLLRSLTAAGIPTMLLKGAPLALGVYRDVGLRPMNDGDILVPPQQAAAAIGVLRAVGWQPNNPLLRSDPLGHIAFYHAAGFRDQAGHEVDLHWALMARQRGPMVDSPLWATARPLQIHGVATLAPDPTDMLLHVCAHGMTWSPTPPLRWVADALKLIDHSPIDQKRLLGLAAHYRASLPVADALAYLNAQMDAALPPDLIAQLRAIPTTRATRAAYTTRLQPSYINGPLRSIWLHYQAYVGTDPPEPIARRPAGFLHYMRHEWQIENPGQIPNQIVQRTMRRVRSVAGWLRRPAR